MPRDLYELMLDPSVSSSDVLSRAVADARSTGQSATEKAQASVDSSSLKQFLQFKQESSISGEMNRGQKDPSGVVGQLAQIQSTKAPEGSSAGIRKSLSRLRSRSANELLSQPDQDRTRFDRVKESWSRAKLASEFAKAERGLQDMWTTTDDPEQKEQGRAAWQAVRDMRDIYQTAVSDDTLTSDNPEGFVEQLDALLIETTAQMPPMFSIFVTQALAEVAGIAGAGALAMLDGPLPAGDVVLATKLGRTGAKLLKASKLLKETRGHASRFIKGGLSPIARQGVAGAESINQFYDEVQTTVFNNIVDNGGDVEAARKFGRAAGILSGAVESLVSPMTIVGAPMKLVVGAAARKWSHQAMGEAMSGAMLRFGINRAVAFGGELSEEAVQGGIEVAASWLGGKLSEDPEVAASILEDYAEQLKGAPISPEEKRELQNGVGKLIKRVAMMQGREAVRPIAGLTLLGIPASFGYSVAEAKQISKKKGEAQEGLDRINTVAGQASQAEEVVETLGTADNPFETPRMGADGKLTGKNEQPHTNPIRSDGDVKVGDMVSVRLPDGTYVATEVISKKTGFIKVKLKEGAPASSVKVVKADGTIKDAPTLKVSEGTSIVFGVSEVTGNYASQIALAENGATATLGQAEAKGGWADGRTSGFTTLSLDELLEGTESREELLDRMAKISNVGEQIKGQAQQDEDALKEFDELMDTFKAASELGFAYNQKEGRVPVDKQREARFKEEVEEKKVWLQKKMSAALDPAVAMSTEERVKEIELAIGVAADFVDKKMAHHRSEQVDLEGKVVGTSKKRILEKKLEIAGGSKVSDDYAQLEAILMEENEGDHAKTKEALGALRKEFNDNTRAAAKKEKATAKSKAALEKQKKGIADTRARHTKTRDDSTAKADRSASVKGSILELAKRQTGGLATVKRALSPTKGGAAAGITLRTSSLSEEERQSVSENAVKLWTTKAKERADLAAANQMWKLDEEGNEVLGKDGKKIPDQAKLTEMFNEGKLPPVLNHRVFKLMENDGILHTQEKASRAEAKKADAQLLDLEGRTDKGKAPIKGDRVATLTEEHRVLTAQLADDRIINNDSITEEIRSIEIELQSIRSGRSVEDVRDGVGVDAVRKEMGELGNERFLNERPDAFDLPDEDSKSINGITTSVETEDGRKGTIVGQVRASGDYLVKLEVPTPAGTPVFQEKKFEYVLTEEITSVSAIRPVVASKEDLRNLEVQREALGRSLDKEKNPRERAQIESEIAALDARIAAAKKADIKSPIDDEIDPDNIPTLQLVQDNLKQEEDNAHTFRNAIKLLRKKKAAKSVSVSFMELGENGRYRQVTKSLNLAEAERRLQGAHDNAEFLKIKLQDESDRGTRRPVVSSPKGYRARHGNVVQETIIRDNLVRVRRENTDEPSTLGNLNEELDQMRADKDVSEEEVQERASSFVDMMQMAIFRLSKSHGPTAAKKNELRVLKAALEEQKGDEIVITKEEVKGRTAKIRKDMAALRDKIKGYEDEMAGKHRTKKGVLTPVPNAKTVAGMKDKIVLMRSDIKDFEAELGVLKSEQESKHEDLKVLRTTSGGSQPQRKELRQVKAQIKARKAEKAPAEEIKALEDRVEEIKLEIAELDTVLQFQNAEAISLPRKKVEQRIKVLNRETKGSAASKVIKELRETADEIRDVEGEIAAIEGMLNTIASMLKDGGTVSGALATSRLQLREMKASLQEHREATPAARRIMSRGRRIRGQRRAQEIERYETERTAYEASIETQEGLIAELETTIAKMEKLVESRVEQGLELFPEIASLKKVLVGKGSLQAKVIEILENSGIREKISGYVLEPRHIPIIEKIFREALDQPIRSSPRAADALYRAIRSVVGNDMLEEEAREWAQNLSDLLENGQPILGVEDTAVRDTSSIAAGETDAEKAALEQEREKAARADSRAANDRPFNNNGIIATLTKAMPDHVNLTRKQLNALIEELRSSLTIDVADIEAAVDAVLDRAEVSKTESDTIREGVWQRLDRGTFGKEESFDGVAGKEEKTQGEAARVRADEDESIIDAAAADPVGRSAEDREAAQDKVREQLVRAPEHLSSSKASTRSAEELAEIDRIAADIEHDQFADIRVVVLAKVTAGFRKGKGKIFSRVAARLLKKGFTAQDAPQEEIDSILSRIADTSLAQFTDQERKEIEQKALDKAVALHRLRLDALGLEGVGDPEAARERFAAQREAREARLAPSHSQRTADLVRKLSEARADYAYAEDKVGKEGAFSWWTRDADGRPIGVEDTDAERMAKQALSRVEAAEEALFQSVKDAVEGEDADGPTEVELSRRSIRASGLVQMGEKAMNALNALVDRYAAAGSTKRKSKSGKKGVLEEKHLRIIELREKLELEGKALGRVASRPDLKGAAKNSYTRKNVTPLVVGITALRAELDKEIESVKSLNELKLNRSKLLALKKEREYIEQKKEKGEGTEKDEPNLKRISAIEKTLSKHNRNIIAVETAAEAVQMQVLGEIRIALQEILDADIHANMAVPTSIALNTLAKMQARLSEMSAEQAIELARGALPSGHTSSELSKVGRKLADADILMAGIRDAQQQLEALHSRAAQLIAKKGTRIPHTSNPIHVKSLSAALRIARHNLDELTDRHAWRERTGMHDDASELELEHASRAVSIAKHDLEMELRPEYTTKRLQSTDRAIGHDVTPSHLQAFLTDVLGVDATVPEKAGIFFDGMIGETRVTMHATRQGSGSSVDIQDGAVNIVWDLDNLTVTTPTHETFTHLGLAGLNDELLVALADHLGIKDASKIGRLDSYSGDVRSLGLEELIAESIDRIDVGADKLPPESLAARAIRAFKEIVSKVLSMAGIKWGPTDAVSTLKRIRTGQAMRDFLDQGARDAVAGVRFQKAETKRAMDRGKAYKIIGADPHGQWTKAGRPGGATGFHGWLISEATERAGSKGELINVAKDAGEMLDTMGGLPSIGRNEDAKKSGGRDTLGDLVVKVFHLTRGANLSQMTPIDRANLINREYGEDQTERITKMTGDYEEIRAPYSERFTPSKEIQKKTWRGNRIKLKFKNNDMDLDFGQALYLGIQLLAATKLSEKSKRGDNNPLMNVLATQGFKFTRQKDANGKATALSTAGTTTVANSEEAEALIGQLRLADRDIILEAERIHKEMSGLTALVKAKYAKVFPNGHLTERDFYLHLVRDFDEDFRPNKTMADVETKDSGGRERLGRQSMFFAKDAAQVTNLQQLTGAGNSPIMVTDAYDVLQKTVEDLARFVAGAEYVYAMRYALESAETADKVTGRFGDRTVAMNWIKAQRRDVESIGGIVFDDHALGQVLRKGIQFMAGNATVAFLSNPGVSMMQVASYWNMASRSGHVAFAHAATNQLSKAEMDNVMARTKVIKNRGVKEPNRLSAILDDPTKVSGRGTSLTGPRDAKEVWAATRDKGMYLTHKADKFTVSRSLAVARAMVDLGVTGVVQKWTGAKGTDAYWDAVAAEADKLVVSTQVQTTDFNRTTVQRERSALNLALTFMRGARSISGSALIRGSEQVAIGAQKWFQAQRSGDATQIQAAADELRSAVAELRMMALTHGMMQQATVELIRKGRSLPMVILAGMMYGDDPEEEETSFLSKMGEYAAGVGKGVLGLPLFGDQTIHLLNTTFGKGYEAQWSGQRLRDSIHPLTGMFEDMSRSKAMSDTVERMTMELDTGIVSKPDGTTRRLTNRERESRIKKLETMTIRSHAQRVTALNTWFVGSPLTSTVSRNVQKFHREKEKRTK